ncbi:MAG TPA: GNAT family N-acetyltransferase [Acidimicrobiales bacterium]
MDATITLRRWVVEDADVLSAVVFANIEHLRPWMPWVADEPVSLATRRRILELWEAGWESGADRHFGIFDGEEAIGSIAAMRRISSGGLEIGYWLDRGHIGRGIATAATRCVTTAALAEPGVVRVRIHHDKANEASAGVPRRLGFTLIEEVAEEVAAPGECGVSWHWEMTASRWWR